MKKDTELLICPICHKQHKSCYNEHSIYKDVCNKQTCFETMFWLDLIENYDTTKNFTIDGVVYEMADKPQCGTLGYGGRKFVIRPHKFNGDTSKDIVTNNLWFRGNVPTKFLSELPDDAIFIKGLVDDTMNDIMVM